MTEADLAELPKVELHVHLEGSISAALAMALAERHGEDPHRAIPLEHGDYPHRFRDFQHFVDTYLAVSRQLRTPEDLCTVAAAFARQQAAQNVRYTEVTFTAQTHVANGMAPTAMWQALRDGFRQVPDTEVRLIVDAVRNGGPAHGDATVSLVNDADAPIAGLGLTGIENSVPERSFAMLRSAADDLGIGLTVHAGETGSPDNVRAALDDLGADRIGHGVAAAADDDLLARLARESVPIEVCPSSNVTLGVVPDLASHPLSRLLTSGLAVTIGSDDPPFFATSITDELRHAVRLGRLGRTDVAELQRRAARASFASAARKQALIHQIDAWEASPSS